MSEPLRIELIELDRALLDGVREFSNRSELASGPERMRVDLGLVAAFSDERPLHGLAGLIDWRASGRLSAVARSGFCTSELGEQLLIPGDRRLPVERLVLVGLGPRDAFDETRARSIGAQMVKISIGLCAQTVLIALGGDDIERSLVEATFEGLVAAIEAQVVSEPDASSPRPEPPPEPDGSEPPEPDSSEPTKPCPEPLQAVTAPPSQPPVRWWIAADESVVARLRRVLCGPPRPARGGPGLHT